MRWRRFPFFFLVGLVLWVAVACTSSTLTPSPSPSPTGVTQEVPAESPKPAPAALPPETAKIVASVGGKGLYNPPRGDVRLVAISDLNSSYGSIDYDPEVETAIKLLPFWQPDMVVCSGDMVAGQDITLTQERIRAMWQGFDKYVGAPLRAMKMPYGFTVGNHDASSAMGVGGKFLFQVERNLTAEYWRDPNHDPGVEFVDRFEFPFYYTFKDKDIFFLSWDGSSNHIPDDKLAWVEKALSSPEAKQAKLRILLGHLPLYAVAIGRNTAAEVMENSDKLRAMLEKYNVHTYISGHHHAYYPAHKGKMQLLHMGILGSGPRPLIEGNAPPLKAMTVIDVNFNSPELTTYTTYNMQTLQPIDHEQLPRFLAGHNGMVLRRDVEESQLSQEERISCAQRLGDALCHA